MPIKTKSNTKKKIGHRFPCILHFCHIEQAYLKIWAREKLREKVGRVQWLMATARVLTKCQRPMHRFSPLI